VFSRLYQGFIKSYYDIDISANKYDPESIPIVKSLLQNMNEYMAKYFIEVDIQTHRNLSEYPFTPKISRSDRQDLAERVKEIITKQEVDIFKQKGRFDKLSYSNEFLNDYPFLKSAGVYRDWPDDRLIYINDNERFILLLNEEDHIKIKLNLKDSASLSNSLLQYYELLELLEKTLPIAIDKDLGYLSTLPNNVGSGTYFRIKMRINGGNEEQVKEIKQVLDKNKSEIEYFLEGDQLVLINKTPFYNFANCLVELLSIKDFLK
jgi:arginine kinase